MMMMNNVSEIMKDRDRIRNISIIAHVDHGKTALTESLAHVHMDVGKEVELGITIKSAAVSLQLSRSEYHRDDGEEKERAYLVNLIDSPGHIDFSSEVTAALRITDGCICVIDCIEGGKTQTETVLRQAILELVKPVLFLNKIDRIWLEKQLPLHEAYKMLRNSIEWTNAICQTYQDDVLGDIEMNPAKCNVGFGSGYFGWGFTVQDFAKMYTSKFGMSTSKLCAKLWGNHYYDAKQKRWLKSSTLDETGTRLNGFCEFILKPLQVLHDAIMQQETAIYLPIIAALRLNISNAELNACAKPKEVLKLVMSRWLPATQCVVDLCADHLPSPLTAQRYRIPRLYSGPLESQEARDMCLCSADGALSMYVSKMIPIEKDPGRFIAFGRVFSGTVKRGQDLRILGAGGQPQQQASSPEMKNDSNDAAGSSQSSSNAPRKKVQGILLMMGGKQVKLSECPAGNICGLMGIDRELTKSGTLCDSQRVFPFKTMKFSVSPVVNVAVNVVDPGHLNKLIEGLQRLSKYDNIIQITQNKQKQHIVAGSGELHLRMCLNTLRESFLGKNVKLNTSTPIVSFCEGIAGPTGSTATLPPTLKGAKANHKFTYPTQICSKSPNKLNRIYMTAEPLSDAVCTAIENDELKLQSSDMKAFGRNFAKRFPEWHKEDAARIWSFGCAPYGKGNVLVDATKGVDYLDKIKSSVIEGFRQITSGGILADEPLRGVRFNIVDAKVHSDPSHHGAGQIISATVRACYGALLASQPSLFEPMYEVVIEVPMECQNGIFNTFGKVRGVFVKQSHKAVGKNMSEIVGHVPILETLKNEKENKVGFTELLRQNTQGKAFATMKFSHWSRVDGDPLVTSSMSNTFVMSIRQRKEKMKMELPNFLDYHDKI